MTVCQNWWIKAKSYGNGFLYCWSIVFVEVPAPMDCRLDRSSLFYLYIWCWCRRDFGIGITFVRLWYFLAGYSIF
jgi:hypothetical protein